MKEYGYQKKGEEKAKNYRMLHRKQIFQKKRAQFTTVSYSAFYSPETWNAIKYSTQGPIPSPLPPLSQSTISFYRRSGKPVFQTRVDPNSDLDPHMTFQSLWCLFSVEDIEEYTDYSSVVKQFEEQLCYYLGSVYHEIKEAAIMAAGNRSIGKQNDIRQLVESDGNQLWVATNHIYEKKLPFEYIFNFLDGNVTAYRTIYELTNIEKDETNIFIVNHSEIMQKILKNCLSKNSQIQQYSIRIIGNILAEKEDYASVLAGYDILEVVFPILKSNNRQIRREVCWLLSNYTFENTASTETLCNQKIMERLLTMFKDETYPNARIELYYIFIHLMNYGNKNQLFDMIKQQKMIQQCAEDIVIDDPALCYVILEIITKIIEIGDEFVDNEEEENSNLFISEINYSPLKKQIQSKTFTSNDSISSLSHEIMEKLNKEVPDFSCDISL